MESHIFTYLPECPHCHMRNMTFYLIGTRPCTRGDGNISAWHCSNCGKGVCTESQLSLPRSGGYDFLNIMATYPQAQGKDAPEFTPKPVADCLVEAKTNLGVGSFTSAAFMARKAVEMAVNELGASGQTLYAKINDLHERGIILAALRDWSHDLREIGNEAAHDATPFTQKDAAQTVHFAEMLFTYLFTLPGMIAERRRQK